MTDFQIEYQENEQARELESVKREYANHSCARHEGQCDTCDKWERMNG